MLLRYEDFVAGPQRTIAAIARMIGEPATDLPFDDERTVRLAPNHTVSGNPSRFTTGSVRIEADDAWRTAVLILLGVVVLMVLAATLAWALSR